MRLEVYEKIKCRGSVPWDIILWPQHCGVFIKQSTVRPVSNDCVAVRVNIFFCTNSPGPISVTARPTAWVCGRSLAGIVGSNPAKGMGVCIL